MRVGAPPLICLLEAQVNRFITQEVIVRSMTTVLSLSPAVCRQQQDEDFFCLLWSSKVTGCLCTLMAYVLFVSLRNELP